jgi:Na+-transporting NADH:ubiquinone oxidoreductase subunit NqrC
MKVYLVSCIVAIIIAAGAMVVLSTIQEDSNIAYATSGVRI